MSAYSSTLRTGEPSLADLLRYIRLGKIQLPDFQRGWVWDDDHIRSLIASVSLAYRLAEWIVTRDGEYRGADLSSVVGGCVVPSFENQRRRPLSGCWSTASHANSCSKRFRLSS